MAVQQTQVLPAPFIEAAGKTYLDELTSAIGGVKSADVSQFYGRDFVAPTSALTQQAETAAGGLTSLMGPQAYQQYMSPYQQDVIDTTLAEFDRQTAMGLPELSNRAIQSGAFGGGRQGVLEAEYATGQARNRAALQAQLLQQGFGAAQELAGRGFQQAGQQISTLAGLGASQQAQQQALLEADKQLAFQQTYQPLQAAQALGAGVTGLIAGYPQRESFATAPASPSPLQTALGTASTLAGIYSLVNPRPLFPKIT
tara:strand:- start:886 stop:1653 length:768 start_codon:yes stop_codon:yes gene_type:complete